jgi:hypothetical protein
VEALALRASMELDLEHFDKAASRSRPGSQGQSQFTRAHPAGGNVLLQNRPSDQDAEIKTVLAINRTGENL